MPSQDWSKIPPEEIKKMIQLQNLWEKNLPSSLKEMHYQTKQLMLYVDSQDDNNKQISTQTKNNLLNNQLTIDDKAKMIAKLMFGARKHVIDSLGQSDNVEQMDKLVNTSFRINNIPFSYANSISCF